MGGGDQPGSLPKLMVVTSNQAACPSTMWLKIFAGDGVALLGALSHSSCQEGKPQNPSNTHTSLQGSSTPSILLIHQEI